MKKVLTVGLLIVATALPIAAYAGSDLPYQTQKAPGFLPDYSLLQQISAKESDTQVYIYKNAAAKRSGYKGVIVDPVILYQTATESGVTSAQIAAAKNEIDDNLKKELTPKIAIVTTPAAGVAHLNVAITGAMLEGDGFKPRNLMPISAVITLASKATGLDNKKPVLIIETKITDSKTDKLLSSSVTVISGEKFRKGASTAEEFVKLAQVWIKDSIQYAVPSNE